MQRRTCYQFGKHEINKYLKKTSHSERLKKLGIEADIAFCLQIDIAKAIPGLEGERLVNGDKLVNFSFAPSLNKQVFRRR